MLRNRTKNTDLLKFRIKYQFEFIDLASIVKMEELKTLINYNFRKKYLFYLIDLASGVKL